MELNFTLTQFIVYLSVALVVLVILLLIFKKLLNMMQRPELVGYSLKQIQERWNEIEQLMNQKNVMSYKLAIIEADKLLDHTLKSLGFPGQDMGQRLKAACYKHKGLRQAWFGHKIRNQLVHETTFNITYWQAKDAMKCFYSALKILNVL